MHVAAWVEDLGKTRAPPTVKLRLAALRRLMDWLVVHQAIPVNPAARSAGRSMSCGAAGRPCSVRARRRR